MGPNRNTQFIALGTQTPEGCPPGVINADLPAAVLVIILIRKSTKSNKSLESPPPPNGHTSNSA